MPSLLERSTRLLNTRLSRAAAVGIVYKRGDRRAHLAEGVPGRRLVEASAQTGAGVVSSLELDWLLDASRLRIDGGKVEPEKGDLIEWRQGDGTTLVYRVVLDANGRPFRVADQLGVLLRVYTKLQTERRSGGDARA